MPKNRFLIRKAGLDNFIEALFIYRSCVTEMNQRGLFNWNPAYPSRDLILRDINSGNLFIFIENHTVLGVICLTEDEPEEYKNLMWNNKERALYVHRLAVHPAFRNNKIGAKMMNFAAEYGRMEGFKSIRLDVIKSNPEAIKLYCNSGYKEIGEIFFAYQQDAFQVLENKL